MEHLTQEDKLPGRRLLLLLLQATSVNGLEKEFGTRKLTRSPLVQVAVGQEAYSPVGIVPDKGRWGSWGAGRSEAGRILVWKNNSVGVRKRTACRSAYWTRFR